MAVPNQFQGKAAEYTAALIDRQRAGGIPVNPVDLAACLSPGGALARQLGGLERREGQIQMALEVDRVLAHGGRVLAEAGPGTGKTFAYLLPALLRARVPDGRIVISTWTRNLQEQIVDKDLPLLKRAFQSSASVALVQGRENYVCRRRAHEAVVRATTSGSPARRVAELRRIAEWSARSRAGTRNDLGFQPGAEVWSAVKAERGNCLAQRSPFFSRCAWQWSRRHARDASLLVVNHALLIADLKLRRRKSSVLPPFTGLIVDEAHHLESVAADHLGIQVRRRGVFGLLGAVERQAGSGAVAVLTQRARAAAEDLFEVLQARLAADQTTLSLDGAAPVPDALAETLQVLGDVLAERAAGAPEEDAAMEWTARAEEVRQLAEELFVVLGGGGSDTVCWLERIDEPPDLMLRSAPVEPASVLRDELFDHLDSVVLTSATLSTPDASDSGDAFAFVRNSTGIGPAPGLEVASPFDYARQVTLVIDALPDPRDAIAWERALAERIPFHVLRTEGRAFVLFTSRRTLLAVAGVVEARLAEHGIELLVQGRDRSRTDLLRRFRSGAPAALFGLASFWEGVDVPGASLSHVILTRLPFPVPGHPRDEARGRRLRARGGDPFRDLSLPQAILRLKQGFGRLIRTEDDRGLVTVLDSRLLSRRYGRLFLAALPGCPRVLMRGDEEIPLPPDDSTE